MYPEQQQPTPTPSPTPVDYLNQIAPQAPKRQLFKPGPKFFALVGGILIVVIIIISITVNAIVASQRHPLEQLSARLASTEKLTTDVKTNLKSSKLRSLNSNLEIYLTNTNRDIAKPLLSAGINTTKLSKSTLSEESSASVADRLEDARLNAILDRTYAREMAYRLNTILVLMKQIYGSTGNSQLKAFLTSAYDNLKPTQEALAAFDETSR